MEESDIELEIENVFDDNIKIQKNSRILQDKTNKNSNRILKDKYSKNKGKIFKDKNHQISNEIFIDKENRICDGILKEKDNQINNEIINDKNSIVMVKKKYNLNFSYEQDKLTNEMYKKIVDEISNNLNIYENNLDFTYDKNKIKEENREILNNYHINENFYDNLQNIYEVSNEKIACNDLNISKNINDENIFINKNEDDKVINEKNLNRFELKDNNLKIKKSINFDKNTINSNEKSTFNNNIDDKNIILNKEENLILNKNNIINFDKNNTVKLTIDQLRKQRLKNINISTNHSTIIIDQIQKEFNDLKDSHKLMLQVRNRLLILIENEIKSIKQELDHEKKAEIEKLKNEHDADILKYKTEIEYYKNKYDKFKMYCKNKVCEYKNRVDDIYKKKMNFHVK